MNREIYVRADQNRATPRHQRPAFTGPPVGVAGFEPTAPRSQTICGIVSQSMRPRPRASGTSPVQSVAPIPSGLGGSVRFAWEGQDPQPGAGRDRECSLLAPLTDQAGTDDAQTWMRWIPRSHHVGCAACRPCQPVLGRCSLPSWRCSRWVILRPPAGWESATSRSFTNGPTRRGCRRTWNGKPSSSRRGSLRRCRTGPAPGTAGLGTRRSRLHGVFLSYFPRGTVDIADQRDLGAGRRRSTPRWTSAPAVATRAT
jgi:hypothetical protein